MKKEHDVEVSRSRRVVGRKPLLELLNKRVRLVNGHFLKSRPKHAHVKLTSRGYCKQ